MMKALSGLHVFKRSIMVMLCALFLLAAFPGQSYASLDKSMGNCGTGAANEVAKRVTSCVHDTVTKVTAKVLTSLSTLLAPFGGAMMAFGMLLFGMRILGQDYGPLQQGAGFAVRLALVGAFISGLGSFSSAPFSLMDDTVGWVSGSDPWLLIDHIIQRIFGTASETTIANGMLGLIGMAFVSSTAASFVGASGLMAVLGILFFILRIIYLYCNALIVIGFMVMIGPLVVPFGIFRKQEHYVLEWINIMVCAALVPAFMFAFLAMSSNILQSTIDDLFKTLGGKSGGGSTGGQYQNPDLRPFYRSTQPYAWTMPVDQPMMKQMNGASNTGKTMSPVQTFVDPMMGHGYNANAMTTYTVDFGKNNFKTIKDVGRDFVLLAIYSMLFRAMLDVIPQVVSGITQANSGVRMSASGIESAIQSRLAQADNK